MIAESPTSPRHRDRIAVDPISTDTIARLHNEAAATGRSIAELAADWLDAYRPPARRVVAVVDYVDVDDEDGVTRRVWRTHGRIAGDWPDALGALEYAALALPHSLPRIHDAGPGRYHLIEETP